MNFINCYFDYKMQQQLRVIQLTNSVVSWIILPVTFAEKRTGVVQWRESDFFVETSESFSLGVRRARDRGRGAGRVRRRRPFDDPTVLVAAVARLTRCRKLKRNDKQNENNFFLLCNFKGKSCS